MLKNIHPFADVQSKDIGEGKRIWQFCVVFAGAKIGAGCNSLMKVLIENDVVFGSIATLKDDMQR